MNHYKLILKHPLFGYSVFEGGAFTESIIRAHAYKKFGRGFSVITLQKVAK
jgi:hypothetical protein